MGMGSLLVVRPGLQTTVQDLGRWGFQSRGVPVAGAMDPFACRLQCELRKAITRPQRA